MFRSIVVGTDGSPTATEAVRHASALAQLSGATVYLVRAWRPGSSDGPADDGEHQALVERELAHDLGWVTEQGVAAEAYARVGHAAEVILDVAAWKEADLVVVGNRGMSGIRRLLGSVPNAVSHHAPCAVLIVATAPAATRSDEATPARDKAGDHSRQ